MTAGHSSIEDVIRLLNLIAMPLDIVKSVCIYQLTIVQKLTIG